MMNRILWYAVVVAAVVVSVRVVATPGPAEQNSTPKADHTLRVMTFNIRYGAANDGDNRWELRREQVVKAIRAFNPDLLGTQEVLDFQRRYLEQHLPEYDFHGVGRDDGKTKGEYAGIFYRRDRFERLDAGHFWLSEHPDEPGSVSWDSSLTRMVSWVILRDKHTQRRFVYFNTHWDHRGHRARLESARLMRRKLSQIAGDLPVIITGDFNTTELGEPYDILVNATEGDGPPLIDAYRQAHPQPRENEASSNGGFRGRKQGRRIDWILHSNDFHTLEAAIHQNRIDGRYPSDHYPVTAVLQWRSATGN